MASIGPLPNVVKCLGAIDSSTKPDAASMTSVGGRIRGTDGSGGGGTSENDNIVVTRIRTRILIRNDGVNFLVRTA